MAIGGMIIKSIKGESDAGTTLPFLQRALRRGDRVLPQGARRRGADVAALQGLAGPEHGSAGHAREDHARGDQDRRLYGGGLGGNVQRRAAKIRGVLAGLYGG